VGSNAFVAQVLDALAATENPEGSATQGRDVGTSFDKIAFRNHSEWQQDVASAMIASGNDSELPNAPSAIVPMIPRLSHVQELGRSYLRLPPLPGTTGFTSARRPTATVVPLKHAKRAGGKSMGDRIPSATDGPP